MGSIILIAFFGVVVLVGVGIAIFTDSEYLGTKVVGGVVAALFSLAIFFTFLFGGEVSVPVNTTAVPQAFGTVAGAPMSSGVHWTWQPWLSTANVDETVQVTNFQPGGTEDGTQPCNGSLPIRIGGQQQACAIVKIKWQVEKSAAEALFHDYANHGDLMMAIKDSVVIQELETVANNVMGEYDPIVDAQNVASNNGTQSLFSTFGPTILRDMQAAVGSQIKVISITMPRVVYSNQIEAALVRVQQSYADYAVAAENVKVNEEKSLALAKLGSPTLAQLIAQCIASSGSSAGQCIPGAVSKLQLSGSPQG